MWKYIDQQKILIVIFTVSMRPLSQSPQWHDQRDVEGWRSGWDTTKWYLRVLSHWVHDRICKYDHLID
jgi:hypothetical protein